MNNKEKIDYLGRLVRVEGMSPADVAGLIQVPEVQAMGDFTLPCFRLAKLMRLAPVVIAEKLATELNASPDAKKHGVKAQAVNGYLNFFFDKAETAKTVINSTLKGIEVPQLGAGKTVCVDYSSINIAKPFHIGHLSTTVIGGALCRIYKRLGYKVVGINHLGDYGTQFGKLISAFVRWGDKKTLMEKGMKYLTELYVRFHKEAEENPKLDDEARAYFKQIEDGDKKAMELFGLFKEITLREVDKVYKKLSITFDSYDGEAFFNDKMAPVLEELKAKHLLVVSEGAQVVELPDMPPCLLVKADGATLYATRDLAAAFYRKKKYNFDKCLYVVAYQQNLHFRQWFKVVELMGYPWAHDLVHVQFGMVSLETGTMSTRKGNVTLLEDVISRACERALEILKEKSPELEGKESVAEKIGVGAVVFSALSGGRIKDIVFSYDKVLNFDGETAPYLQYTVARCNSILKKANETVKHLTSTEGIINPEGEELVALIGRYPEVVADSAEKYEPSLISRHIMDTAQAFNRFYLNHRILNCTDLERPARLALVASARAILVDGLSLLGIECPEAM